MITFDKIIKGFQVLTKVFPKLFSRNKKLTICQFFLCPYCTKLEPIFKAKDNFTRHARGNSEAKYPLGERPATRLADSADTRNKKFSLHFPIWRVEEFLLNGKENFVSGVLPSRIQAVGGARFGLGKVKTIFWGFGFHFSETEFLIWGFCPPAGGVWGGMRAGFSFCAG